MTDFSFHHLAPYMETIKNASPSVLAVAGAEDLEVLATVKAATEYGLVMPILFGNGDEVERLVAQAGMNSEDIQIENTDNPSLAAARAVGGGEADVLMKGLVSSGAFLRAVLSDKAGLREGSLLSHIGFFDIATHSSLLGMTDGGINIRPDFSQKIAIVKNAVKFGRRVLGRPPRIALLAAVENVQESMPVTLEWAAIAKMAERGQLGEAEVEGPLGLDNAIDPQAAKTKGLTSSVAGRADIVVVPDIHAGNLMGKTLTFLARAPMAGVVVGARAPIVLNSRADSARARFASIVLACAAALTAGGA